MVTRVDRLAWSFKQDIVYELRAAELGDANLIIKTGRTLANEHRFD
jgi:hypothetical protein